MRVHWKIQYLPIDNKTTKTSHTPISWAHSTHNPQRQLDLFSRFCTTDAAFSLCYTAPLYLHKFPIAVGDLNPLSNTSFLSPPDPEFAVFTNRWTDKPTERRRNSTSTNRLLALSATRPRSSLLQWIYSSIVICTSIVTCGANRRPFASVRVTRNSNSRRRHDVTRLTALWDQAHLQSRDMHGNRIPVSHV